MDLQEDALKERRCPGGAGWGREDERYHDQIVHGNNGLYISGGLESLPGSYQSYYAGICAASHGKKPVSVTAADALPEIKVIECARLRSKMGRAISFS